MFKTSDRYKELIRASDYSSAKIYGNIVLLDNRKIELGENNIQQQSVTIDLTCSSGTSLEIGSVIKNKLTFSFYSEIGCVYDLIGATVKLYFSLEDEEIPLGTYTIAEPARSGRLVNCECYDNMSKIDTDIGNVATNGTAYNILSWISRRTGIELANSEEEINSMTNSSVIMNAPVGVYGSYIDILAEACSIICAFATINRLGQLEIREYHTEPDSYLLPKQITSVSLSDFTCRYTDLIATIDSVQYTNSVSGSNGLKYYLNTDCIGGNESVVNNILRNIINKLSKIEYTPCDLSILMDPALDLGDMITLLPDGIYIVNNTNTIITSMNFKFLGACTLGSAGENPYLQEAASSSSGVSRSSSSAVSKNNGTYIATFENAGSYSVGQVISSIDYTLGENDITVCSGQFEIDVSTAGTMQIHYLMDGVENSFVPEQYLTAGKHIINLSCWFKMEDSNKLINYSVRITTPDGLTGTVAADKVRSFVLGTTTSDGKFATDNVFYETVNFRKYVDNSTMLGWEAENEE